MTGVTKNEDSVKNKDTSFGSLLHFSSFHFSFLLFLWSGSLPSDTKSTCQNWSLFQAGGPLWRSTCTPNPRHTPDLGSKLEKKNPAGFTSWLKMLFVGRNPFWHDGESPQIPSHGQLVCPWNVSQNKGLVVYPRWIPATRSKFTRLDFPLLSIERHTWLVILWGGAAGESVKTIKHSLVESRCCKLKLFIYSSSHFSLLSGAIFSKFLR